MQLRNKKIFVIGIICIIAMLLAPMGEVARAMDAELDWPVMATEPRGKSVILMEKETGAILYGKNVDEVLYPASITKIMTGLLAIENLNLNDTITFTNEMLEVLPYDAARQGVVAGETMTVRDCLYSLLLRSNNDMAVALAYAVSGSEEEFAKLMTQRAKEIGATNTNFANASGLHDAMHYTTARDMALITIEAMSNPTFAKMWGTDEYTISASNISPEFTVWHRHNMLVSTRADYYKYATGGKTGYTDEAGRTLVTSAKKDGMELVAVILYSTTDAVFPDTKELMNYGFNNFSKIVVQANENRFGLGSSSEDIVSKVYGDRASLFQMGEGSAVIPNNLKLSDISYTLDYGVNGVDEFAYVSYEYGGYPLGGALLYKAKKDHTNATVTSSLEKEVTEEEKSQVKEILSINIYHIIIAVVVVIILIVLMRIWIKSVKRRRIGKKYYTNKRRY